jgi:hypothetical protein
MSLISSNPLYQLAVGERLDPQGAWFTATAYDRLQTVDNDGSSYVCMVAHTAGASTEPGTGADWRDVWQVLAEKGEAGDEGPAGPAGPAGPDPTGATAGHVWTADGDDGADWAAAGLPGPDPTGATAGHVWTADGDDGADWAAAGLPGPDPTGATAGHVWTADGDDGADWAAPGGGGGGDSWTSIANPAAALIVEDTGTNLATLALDGTELVAGARLDWRMRVLVTDNPNSRQIAALVVQCVNGDVTVYARIGLFSTVTSAAVGTVLSMTGSVYVIDASASSVLAAEWLPSRHSSTADGILAAGNLNAGNFGLAGDINDVITLRVSASANAGNDLEMQALELAYKITPPTT